MTARPTKRRGASVTAAPEFPEVEVPAKVLTRARREPEAFAAVDVVEGYLREIHGPAPDHRDDRDRWLCWVEAVEERALSFLEDGRLA